VRPLVNAGRLRVIPEVEPLAIETAAGAAPMTRPAPATAAPVVIVNRPAPPPEPEVVGVPVPYAYPVAVVSPDSHGGGHRASSQPVLPPVVPLSTGRRDRGARAAGSVKRFKSPAESALAERVVQELDNRAFAKALTDLDSWTQQFRATDFADERLYYYMLAYNGANQPAKVLESGAPLVVKPVTAAFDDAMQQLSVVYLTAMNYQRVGRPTRDQSSLAQFAAREMLRVLPACFAPERRPEGMTDADWSKSRADLEALAKQTIARAGR
jgi:hypothetical protein